jgi:hypothetical protein
MDEVQLILTALGAGAAAAGAGTVQGLSDSARAAVVEALTALRERLTDRLERRRILRSLSWRAASWICCLLRLRRHVTSSTATSEGSR